MSINLKYDNLINRVLSQRLEEIKENKFPKYIYKFSPINSFAIRNLVNYQIWCSSPTSFNDPFDCMFNGKTYINENQIKVDNGNKKVLAEMINKDAKSQRISCFCDLDNPSSHPTLMWSHYADSHKGICFKYNLENLIKHWIKNAPLTIIQPVNYKKTFPKIPIKFNDKDRTITLSMDFLYTKSSDWKYEQEIRVFSKSNVLPINLESISQIHFGCESSISDQIDIINIVRKFSYKKVSFFKASKSTKEFKLELISIKG